MSIRHVTWWGFYFVQWDTPYVPDKFTLKFFKDLNGLPGQLRISIPISEEHLTREPAELSGVPGVSSIWKYSVDLFEAFGEQGIQEIAANETEWIAIVNDTAASDDYYWIWSVAVGGDSDGNAGHFVPVSNPDTIWTSDSTDFALEFSAGDGPVYDVDLVDGELDVHLDAVSGGDGLAYLWCGDSRARNRNDMNT